MYRRTKSTIIISKTKAKIKNPQVENYFFDSVRADIKIIPQNFSKLSMNFIILYYIILFSKFRSSQPDKEGLCSQSLQRNTIYGE